MKQMMLAKMFTNFSIVLYLIISSAPLVSTWLGKLHTANPFFNFLYMPFGHNCDHWQSQKRRIFAPS